MKKIFSFCTLVLLLSFVLSCSKSNNDTNFAEIENLITTHGNLTGDIVVVNTQGGPVTKLHDETLKEFITQTQTSSALYVNVHQEQTRNSTPFLNSDITFEKAKQFDNQSVINLKKVIDYYKNQNKTVYILGISFGAFMTQELISNYGINVADGYLIMVGRLNIDKETWEPFSQGKFTEYVYDDNGNYTINILPDAEVEQRNMARLAAGLGFNRYIDKLGSIGDLSKITYVYGDRDEQVGPLSSEEIQFLENKNSKVLLSENGNHDQAITTGLNILKETFKIK